MPLWSYFQITRRIRLLLQICIRLHVFLTWSLLFQAANDSSDDNFDPSFDDYDRIQTDRWKHVFNTITILFLTMTICIVVSYTISLIYPVGQRVMTRFKVSTTVGLWSSSARTNFNRTRYFQKIVSSLKDKMHCRQQLQSWFIISQTSTSTLLKLAGLNV